MWEGARFWLEPLWLAPAVAPAFLSAPTGAACPRHKGTQLVAERWFTGNTCMMLRPLGALLLSDLQTADSLISRVSGVEFGRDGPKFNKICV